MQKKGWSEPLLILAIFLLFEPKGAAQDSTLVIEGSLQLAVANNDAPFWSQMNQYGATPSKGPYVSGRWGIHRSYSKISSFKDKIAFFDWSAGARLITNLAKDKTDVFFTDLFLAIKAGALEISVGQREDAMGLCDSTLTSGSVSMSGNSRPYPKIQLALPNFYNLHFLDDFVGFKASYSDGILGPADVQYGNVNYIPKVYLHQKSFYFRLGRPWQKLNLYSGINHQAMWGGENKIFSGGLPPKKAYEYVVIGKPWAASRVGNHFGTIDLGAELKTSNWEYFLYRQNIYEDGSLIQLMNISDGLNGLRIKKRHFDPTIQRFQVRSFVFELLNTSSQSGPVFDSDAGIFGSDNYFNHYVYRQGWSYRGRTLGTPLIVPQNFMNNSFELDSSSFTINNRQIAIHVGLDARFQGTDLRLLATYSSNKGSYAIPITPASHQLSILARASRHFPALMNSHVTASIIVDAGKLYKNNSALSISWTKRITY